MDTITLALFGEAEKGAYRTAYYCTRLDELQDRFGNPPPGSRGLHIAIQALLYDFDLIFFRVREEGFSYEDYLQGVRILEHKKLIPVLSGICAPGVGDDELITTMSSACQRCDGVLIMSEADLYDYLTGRR